MLTIALTVALAGWSTCSKPAPEPRSFHSRGFGRVAEVFPPFSRQNEGARPVAYLYHVGYPGPRWEINPRLTASVTLPHEAFPAEAVVSTAGHLVLLDDYYQSGQANSVVVVDSAGTSARSYALDELLREDEISALERSDCGIHWRSGARYFFLLGSEPRFYIVLDGGPVLELELEERAFRRGPPTAFPDLLRVMERSFPDEEVQPWSISLRFSSITDILRGR